MSSKLFLEKKFLPLQRLKCHNLVEAALQPAHYLGSKRAIPQLNGYQSSHQIEGQHQSFTVLWGQCCWKSINFITLTVGASLSFFLSPDPTETLAFSEYFEGNYANHFHYVECLLPHNTLACINTNTMKENNKTGQHKRK